MVCTWSSLLPAGTSESSEDSWSFVVRYDDDSTIIPVGVPILADKFSGSFLAVKVAKSEGILGVCKDPVFYDLRIGAFDSSL